jgi:hypothetical protein
MRRYVISNVLGLVGAVCGGILGVILVDQAAQRGLYAIVLPGGLVGLGCGLLARHRSLCRGIACGIGGLAAGLYAEWHVFHSRMSLAEFSKILGDLGPFTYLLLAVGAVVAFWAGRDYFGSMFGGRQVVPPAA